MTSPLQPPGGIYWQAALFGPFVIAMPIQIGMQASAQPHVGVNISLPLQFGATTPTTTSINLPLFVAMFPRVSVPASFNIGMSIGLGMSPFTPFAINFSLQVGMQVNSVLNGIQLNTTVQRSATR